MPFPEFADPAAVAEALDAAGYLPDQGVATAAHLAIRMGRPLFVEGDPGVGKTSLAHALAAACQARLWRLQCYEGIDASQALYDWDFPRQMLHLRAAGDGGNGDLEASLYDRRFLISRPILSALESSPSVLLIDEIDRADDEFEAFLLEVLAENSVTIPELGTITATERPLTVITSNRTRRGARCAQAPLPVSLVVAPRPTTRGRDRPAKGAWRFGGIGCRRRRHGRPAAGGAFAETTRRRRDDRLDRGAAHLGRDADASGTRRGPRWAQR